MEIKISDIGKRFIDKSLLLNCLVEGVVQTTGPTLFNVSDGTGTIALKGFDGAGIRAFPGITEKDCIQAKVKIKEFNGALEGEIQNIRKLSEQESKKLSEQILEIQRKRAKVESIPFLVESNLLNKLKENFIKAATEIRLAVIQSRPIIVRHHNDTDGYSSGYSLERAILPLVQKQHGNEKSRWTFFERAPCAAPFYEIEDSIKDTARSLMGSARFSEKMPLVVIVDNGSSEEDLIPIKQGKIHGIDFIVVDHHYFDKDVISKEVLVHINPFLVEEDGSTFSAGMLCVELARFINPKVERIDHIPALAGQADRIKNPKAMEEYFNIAKSKGYTKELLIEISAVIDFVSTKLRFMEAREYIEVVFGEDITKQKDLVSLIYPNIKKLTDNGRTIGLSAVKKETIKDKTLQILMVEETFSRFSYPKPGQCVGLVHDVEVEKSSSKKVVTIGVLSDLVTIRATEDSGFSVHNFLQHLKKNLPEAFADGGGHHSAGAIRFIPSKQKEILEQIRTFIKNLN